MKRSIMLGAALTVVGCSLGVAAPVNAATPQPTPSAAAASSSTGSRAATDPNALYEPVIDDLAYDATTRQATLTVSNNHPSRSYRVSHWNPDQTEWLGDKTIRVDSAGDAWVDTFDDVFKGDVFVIRQSLQTPVATAVVQEGIPAPEAHVETTVENGVVHISYSHYRSGWAYLHDQDGRQVGKATFPERQSDGAFVHTLTIPDTGRASSYHLNAWRIGGISDEVAFTVNESMGASTPDAPTINSVSSGGSRTLATIAGERGAVMTVKNANGITVGVKVVGGSAVAQVTLRASSSRAPEQYSVTQTAGGATSEATHFTA